MSSFPPLIFFSLTPEEEEEDSYPQSPQDYEETSTNWLDDSECQENLFHILSLTPEETIIDKDNHCIHTFFQIFFEELGYFTEEPEPIDPTRDYESEAKILLNQRDNKKVVRQKHVDLSRIPSLDYSRSGLSSRSSSIHHEHNFLTDIRSPHYMGTQHHNNHSNSDNAYHYSEKHHFIHRPSRLH
ncbi:hypothetical protein INT48_004144 [Thamnidium elegans]|uniref:Uncharacterized protein n=1 Tax=Thamnidium elegans TaxID=101142 RepID=A0A8H7SUL9_9FUNG|nr:hypothetical protein INT48_004144 [Thamnidium elegans]